MVDRLKGFNKNTYRIVLYCNRPTSTSGSFVSSCSFTQGVFPSRGLFEVLHSVARLCKVFFKSGIRCIPIESILDRLRGSPLWAFLKSTSEQRNERMRGEGPGPGVKPAFGASFLFISSKSCRIGRYRRRCRCRWRGCIGWAAKESAICPLFRLLRVRLAAPFCSK